MFEAGAVPRDNARHMISLLNHLICKDGRLCYTNTNLNNGFLEYFFCNSSRKKTWVKKCGITLFDNINILISRYFDVD